MEPMSEKGGTLDPRVLVLLDKDEITDAIHRVAHGTDRLDRELIMSGYHPDAFDDHNHFRGGPVEFADWVLEMLSRFDYTQHLLGQCRIEVDGDEAFAETYCNSHHVILPTESSIGSDLRLGLRYVDRLERRDGGPWLIATRICAFEWNYTLPLQPGIAYADDFTVGHRDRSDITYTRAGLSGPRPEPRQL